jgi:uncharacterized membrane protein (UPF0127 family)
MKAYNVRNKRELSHDVQIAENVFHRLKGLIGRDTIAVGEALWIKPCNSIHTFLMRFPIDVIFLNRNNMVIAFKKNLQPNRLTRLYFKAVSVLELPAGAIDATDTEIGDKIEFK